MLRLFSMVLPCVLALLACDGDSASGRASNGAHATDGEVSAGTAGATGAAGGGTRGSTVQGAAGGGDDDNASMDGTAVADGADDAGAVKDVSEGMRGAPHAGSDSESSCVSEAGGSCDAQRCCPGSLCIQGDASIEGCRPRCDADEDCPDGCCRPLSNGGNFCAPADACAGSGSQTSCLDEVDASCAGAATCCSDLVCITYLREGGPSLCKQRCEAAGDCDSGCCTPVSDGSLSYCQPAEACQCQQVGSPCDHEQLGRGCCEGGRCLRYPGEETGHCYAVCQTDPDCDEGACVSTANGSLFCDPDATPP